MTDSNIPETALEAIRYFGEPQNCHDFLVGLRWANGVKCPHCGSDKVGSFSGKRMVSNCKNCKKQFTVKVGTIFEDSPLPLTKWIPAVWLIVNAKNGISSCELHRALGVTQKTAWHMAHRIRRAIHAGCFTSKLSGTVEVDETFIGARARFQHKGKRTVQGNGPIGKTAVQGLLERHNGKRASSRVALKVVNSTRRYALQTNVYQLVERGSEVMTDALRSYNGLSDAYTHKVIDHAECYVKGNVHTNGLENFWSLLKRSLKGTYVHCAPFHLHRYLDEQAYRFNERKEDDSTRFVRAMRKTPRIRLTYARLTGKQ
jgi:transposase-like protein